MQHILCCSAKIGNLCFFVAVDILILLFVLFGSFEILTDKVLKGPDCSFLLQLVSADLSEHKLVFILAKNRKKEKVNPLFSGNAYTSNFASSEDPDEIQHAVFHLGLHCL